MYYYVVMIWQFIRGDIPRVKFDYINMLIQANKKKNKFAILHQ